MSFLGTLGKIGLAPITGGASLLSEQKLHGLPLIGGFFDDPAAEAKQKALGQLAAAYQAQRPEMAQSQTNALNQTLGAYAPANNMMGQMYGPSAMQDLTALGQNPMTPGMMDPGVGPVHEAQQQVERQRAEAARKAAMTPNGYTTGSVEARQNWGR